MIDLNSRKSVYEMYTLFDLLLDEIDSLEELERLLESDEGFELRNTCASLDCPTNLTKEFLLKFKKEKEIKCNELRKKITELFLDVRI